MSYLGSKIDRWNVKLTFVGKIEGYKNHRAKYEVYKSLSPIFHCCNISTIPNKFSTVRCVTPLVEKNNFNVWGATFRVSDGIDGR